jgi:oxygen-independent coproporphyrinogen-3 oxidase
MNETDAGFGIYIHWPFCLSKCPYCDFNSHVAAAIDQKRWRRALRAELDHFAQATRGRTVTSVFFGGGTPSLMAPETAAALIEDVRRHWPVADDLEITLEANPTSVEAGRLEAFADAGVNRVSLGVQALNAAALTFLGRGHTVREALDAVALAADRFPRFSFDLIYGRPGQTVPEWRGELSRALTHAGGHLALYQLTIEPGTPFFRDGVQPADEDTGAALYETTQELLEARGLPAYEVSNHARLGAECRHNLTYWQGGDYVGVGPGAHGRLTGDGGTDALYQIHAPERWLNAVEATGHATAKRARLAPEERREELLMMGLRLRDGVNRQRFRAQTESDVTDSVDAHALARLLDGGFLTLDARSLRATPAGRLRLNAVLAALLH